MRAWLLGFLGSLALASPPLQVVAVVRLGMPPFEDAPRLYRLEGEGFESLRTGERFTLQRAGDQRDLGRFQVTTLEEDHALARRIEEGETYPMKGDRVVRFEEALDLPLLPEVELPGPALDLNPRVPLSALPGSANRTTRREPIFFLKGSAELSPAGRNKLAAWVQSWGRDGRWILVDSPEGPPVLREGRAERVRAELRNLGVGRLEVRTEPVQAEGRYDVVFLTLEPW